MWCAVWHGVGAHHGANSCTHVVTALWDLRGCFPTFFCGEFYCVSDTVENVWHHRIIIVWSCGVIQVLLASPMRALQLSHLGQGAEMNTWLTMSKNGLQSKYSQNFPTPKLRTPRCTQYLELLSGLSFVDLSYVCTPTSINWSSRKNKHIAHNESSQNTVKITARLGVKWVLVALY